MRKSKTEKGLDLPREQPVGASINHYATDGFILRRLLLLGSHVPSAELRFKRGLNVISGPSDTGKSFAFACIDYMLGAKKRPKIVPESLQYEKCALEIEAADGQTFTYERYFENNVVRWYESSFDDINRETPFTSLKALHSSNSSDTISYRLLTLSGLASRVLLRNKKTQQTRTISFRNVAKLLVVDEVQILTTNSPVLGSQRTDETADKSLVSLMLTGVDESSTIELSNKTVSRQRLTAQADLLDGLLMQPESEGDTLASTNLVSQKIALQQHIDSLTIQVEESSGSVDEAVANKESVLDHLQVTKSRLIVVAELLARFGLLRKSYDSDLQRLDFIAEGHHYFSQLISVNCPVCNRSLDELDESSHVMCKQGTEESDNIQQACSGEAVKIRTQLKDLESAMSNLRTEQAELASVAGRLSTKYSILESDIKESLRPRLVNTTRELRRALIVRDGVYQQEALLNHKSALLDKRREIAYSLQALEVQPEGTGQSTEVPYDDLSKEITDLIEQWHYSGGNSVTFDKKAMDIIVDGSPRATHGKGVRALLYTAVVIAFMRFCRRNMLPHPGFVVLDSPLTSYRPGDSSPDNSDIEISPDMQRAFFAHLASSTAQQNEQVIIFENKDPQPEIRSNINFVQFSGVPGIGRAGFIPT